MIHRLASVGDSAFFSDEKLGGVDVHESAEVMAFASVDRGTVFVTTVGARTKVGRYAYVAHDATVCEDVTICPGAIVGGFVVIEPGAYIGLGAKIKQRVRIGRDALVGMGAVVTKDVPPNVIVVGNPARFLRLRYGTSPDLRNAKWNGGWWVNG